MFLILKMAVVTCAFYLAAGLLLEALLFLATFLFGGLMYTLHFKVWALIFGAIWLASFALAWRVIMVPLLARVTCALGQLS
jgi:hypothetical protein